MELVVAIDFIFYIIFRRERFLSFSCLFFYREKIEIHEVYYFYLIEFFSYKVFGVY